MPTTHFPTIWATYMSEEGWPCTVWSKWNKFGGGGSEQGERAGPARGSSCEHNYWQEDMTENITFQQLADGNNCNCTLPGRKTTS